MTRAPRSASWRVAKGAAMACSRVTMVMPCSGLMLLSSLDGRGGFHGQPTLVVLGPQAEGLAVGLGLAADVEGVDVEHRPHGAEFVARHHRIRQLVAQQVQ